MQQNQTPAAKAGAVTWPRVTSAISANPAIESRIDALLDQMSLEEKIGQMIQPEIRHVTPDDVRDYHLGSILNGGGSFPNGNKYAPASEWVALADGYFRASVDKRDGRTGIPLMWGTDAVHGLGNVMGATLFPHNIALGAARNPELMRAIGEATAREISATGLDWNFSPTVAVARDDRWGRTYEAWSEDPEIVRLYAGKMVEGLQGDGAQAFTAPWQVIATAKHFIGDGGTVDGIDRGDNTDAEADLRDIHGAGYFSALEAGVQVVMASFNSWHDERLHGHHHLLTRVLKEQMGFDGLVVGDWSGHGFIPGATAHNCPQAVLAGLDIFMIPDPDWRLLYDNTLIQAKDGTLPMARIDDAVRRILRVKLRAGLFDKAPPSERPLAGQQSVLGAPEHRAIARQAVRESLVMLKNRDQLLPLSPTANILLAGDGVDNIGKQAGGWSISWQGTGNSNSDFPGASSILAGIRDLVDAAGGTLQVSESGDFTSRPDVAVIVFGEEPYAEMQGDVHNLQYKPGDERDLELLRRLRSQNIPVVGLFITGRPLWINRELNTSDAFVVIWQPGTEGAGVADVLFTDATGQVRYPMQGQLSFSWPSRPDQGPINRGDGEYQPLFPYGYGLAYGQADSLGDDLPEVGMTVQQAADVLPLFHRRPLAPWRVEAVGGANDRAIMSGSQVVVSTVTISSVDKEVQEDARRAVWNGEGFGMAALTAPGRQDLTEYLLADGALVFEVLVHAAPSESVVLRVGSGPYCASELELTELLCAQAGKGWQTLSIPLNTLPKATSDFGMLLSLRELFNLIVEPFALATRGTLDLAFADVRLEKGGQKPSASQDR